MLQISLSQSLINSKFLEWKKLTTIKPRLKLLRGNEWCLRKVKPQF